jgi:glycosyltransferase involved in cell wall biosynthesis
VADRPVLFLAYAGVLGGAERVLLDCATRLGRPTVVACPPGELATAAARAGLAVEPLPERTLHRGAAHAAGLAALARNAHRLLHDLRPAALVAWGARAVIAAAFIPRRGSPPRLAVHHDLLAAPSVLAAARAATARADAVVVASAAVAARLCRPDAAVLHPGVDLARFAPTPLPPGPSHALVLGALAPSKRIELALEVAARVPGLRLTIAGAPLPGGERYAGSLRARATPDVTFAGPLADPRPALRAAHVLLHCADAEAYGLALVEAMATGRPVVAPAANGPREIVAPGTGRLFTPGDAEDAAAAVRSVLADSGAPAAARTHAETHFDIDASSARFEASLQEIAG